MYIHNDFENWTEKTIRDFYGNFGIQKQTTSVIYQHETISDE